MIWLLSLGVLAQVYACVEYGGLSTHAGLTHAGFALYVTCDIIRRAQEKAPK